MKPTDPSDAQSGKLRPRGLLGRIVAATLLGAGAGGAQFELLMDEEDEGGDSFGQETAGLKVDTDATDLLARAEEFAKQGRYDLASTLWQKVIDGSNDLVFTRDEWRFETLENEYQRYRSVTGDIESTLAELPEEGLDGYRIEADGEAKRILASPGSDGREAALAEVVRRFFLSSLGDDAAFELACLKLDRYEFLPAIRLLEKVLDEYPESNVERDVVLLRLAALNARVGDPNRAQAIIADLRTRVTPSVPDSVLDLVEADAAAVAGADLSEDSRAGELWPMAMGRPERTGVMPAPAAVKEGAVAEGWGQPTELVVPDGFPEFPKEDATEQALNAVDNPFGVGLNVPNGNDNKKPATPKTMLEDWTANGWFPAGKALFHGGRIYFKNHGALVCADAATGAVRWWGFENAYPFPPVYAMAAQYGRNGGSGDSMPNDPLELQNFGDQIHQSMCVVRDKVLVLQGKGKPLDFLTQEANEAAAPDQQQLQMMRFNRGGGGVLATRFRENRLAAYHARNGKVLWVRTASEPDAEVPKRSCFAGPPVPYAGLVLVPVLEDRGMYLAALEPEGGATLWKTFLADEPASVLPGSAIMIAVSGGEAYVGTGAGMVFSVDAISGAMNWAVRYPRSTSDDPAARQQMQRFGRMMPGMASLSGFDGWAEEMVIPAGNTVIATPVDFDHVVGFDRRSGELLWESARRPGGESTAATHALGVRGGNFYVAGRGVVRCYRASGGRLLWEKTFEPGFGRAALTDAGVFATSGRDGVVQLDFEGELVASHQVELEADQPVGNLYSDGSQLYGIGMRRVYSITTLTPGEQERRRAAQEDQAAAGGSGLGDMDGIAAAMIEVLEGYPDAVAAAAGGDADDYEALIVALGAVHAALEEQPGPTAEVVEANKRRLRDAEAAMGEEMSALLGSADDPEKLLELSERFDERTRQYDALLVRFGLYQTAEEEVEVAP